MLVSTCGDSVVSSSTEIDLNHRSGCTHEEADTRVFLHAAEKYNNTNCWHWRCCTCNLCRWKNKGGRAVGCIWDWNTFQIHCSPRECFKSWYKSRVLPAFHVVTDCDTVSFFGWKGKTEALKHMNCIPYSGVGFFRSWYWESESLTRCIWEDWVICCVHVWKEQCSDNSECSKAKAVFSTMQSHQHIYLHRAPRLPSPSAWGWTKDSHGNHYGQHFVRHRFVVRIWGLVLRADALWLQTGL